MQPRFRRHGSMIVAGLSARTSNHHELDPDRGKIPALWRRFYDDVWAPSVVHRVSGAVPLGVYMEYDDGVEGQYTVIAGAEVTDLSHVRDPLRGVSIDEGDYLVFTGQGPLDKVAIATWRHVWEFFAAPRCDGLRRRFTADFERYVSDNFVEIWIAVETGG